MQLILHHRTERRDGDDCLDVAKTSLVSSALGANACRQAASPVLMNTDDIFTLDWTIRDPLGKHQEPRRAKRHTCREKDFAMTNRDSAQVD
jgi:uncharacterized UBP type Zn finger protein